MAKRASPDSVICIDLTEDDDEFEKKLGDIRKRLKASRPSATKVKTEGVLAARGDKAEIIELDDDDDGGGKIGSCTALQQQHQWSSEVVVVEPVAPEIHAVASTQAASANDDVLVVGTANESRLPHMRQHCTENKFVQDVISLNSYSHTTAPKSHEMQEGKTGNVKFCDLCFCYVCDKPAKECTNWDSMFPAFSTSHCHACDTGTDGIMWKSHRAKAKNAANQQVEPTQEVVRTAPPASTITHRLQGKGPYEPDNELAASAPDLTKCRKCGWYNRFLHRNFARLLSVKKSVMTTEPPLHPVGFLDWCHSCGRVASEKDFGKVQAQAYTRKRGDIFLGEKTIPFSIVAHDPRNFAKYKQRWKDHEGSGPEWTFSESEMEEDVFRHRLGQYPSLQIILASIPVLPKDKLPKEGSLYMKTDGTRYGFTESYYDVEPPANRRVSADETEAIIVDDRHRVLLEELFNFGSVGRRKDAAETPVAILDGDIVASWNASERRGVRYFVDEVHPCLWSFLFH